MLVKKTKIIKIALSIIALLILSVIGHNTIKEYSSDNIVTVENTEKKFDKTENVYQENLDLIDINSATAEELDTLPDIGPKKAAAIVEIRKKMYGFQTVNDLFCVDGIGEKTLEKIRHQICVKEYVVESEK